MPQGNITLVRLIGEQACFIDRANIDRINERADGSLGEFTCDFEASQFPVIEGLDRRFKRSLVTLWQLLPSFQEK